MADDLSWGARGRDAAPRPRHIACLCAGLAAARRVAHARALRLRCADDDEYEVPVVAKDAPVTNMKEEEEEEEEKAAVRRPRGAAAAKPRCRLAPRAAHRRATPAPVPR
jgi:hypothetical protein